jgi:hypothetical protein
MIFKTESRLLLVEDHYVSVSSTIVLTNDTNRQIRFTSLSHVIVWSYMSSAKQATRVGFKNRRQSNRRDTSSRPLTVRVLSGQNRRHTTRIYVVVSVCALNTFLFVCCSHDSHARGDFSPRQNRGHLHDHRLYMTRL